jgi:hypothetical protein
MKERTEEQIFSKAPITVTFGSESYDLKPLSINKAREWRSQLLTTMKKVVGDMSAEQTPTSFGPALASSLVAFPELVAELVFAWAPELPKEKISDEATDEQLAEAYKAVMVVAYPFLAPLVLSMKVTKSQLN